jgi:hypothetical protein
VVSRCPLREDQINAVRPNLITEIRKIERSCSARAVSKIMGCGKAGQQLANVPTVCLENAARIRHNLVLDEFNITALCCFDDVGLAVKLQSGASKGVAHRSKSK